MNVIPVINCPDIDCARKRLEVMKTFLREGELVHLDITDGSFSVHKTWNDPLGWLALRSSFALEVHLMVEQPEDYIDNWLTAGARRLIVHLETIAPPVLHAMVALAEQHNAEIVLSSRAETAAESYLPYIPKLRPVAFQVLAVQPGPADQKFLPFVQSKIHFLREVAPDATIEVDGGMDPETTRLVKTAGADTVTASHYIFSAVDPKKAHDELINI